MLDAEPHELFVAVARVIQRAESLSAIVQALPGCDEDTRAAAHGCLAALELSLAQCTAASLEHARDQRIEARRKLARLLADKADPELAGSLAELAVQAVAAMSNTLAIARAAAGAGTAPIAFAGLAGVTFVSARAHQLAFEHGVTPPALEVLLTAAAAPIRKACQATEVCSVGELRHTAHSGALSATARLDRSRDGAPIIAIHLSLAGELPPAAAPSTNTPPYPARLLRKLVS
jgi:hypothetical protein